MGENCELLFVITDWVLKKEDGLAGDSLFYLDKLERTKEEEARKERERRVMQEGRYVSIIVTILKISR